MNTFEISDTVGGLLHRAKGICHEDTLCAVVLVDSGYFRLQR
jgi:hypothetical protein